jgi:membrane-associated phospholipid phosphatase
MPSIEPLADFLARNAVALLIATTFLMLGATALLWRIIEASAPPVARYSERIWNAIRHSHWAQRMEEHPKLRPLVTGSIGMTRFLGVYALLAFLVAFGAGAAFIELIGEIGETLGEFDTALSAAMHAHISPATLQAFGWISHLGGWPFLVTLCVIIAVTLAIERRWVLATAWTTATLTGSLLNTLLKWLFQRERPPHDHAFAETTWSFPSGHASGSMLVYSLLGYLIVLHTPRRYHVPAALAAVALIVFVGASRVILQVHYFSDVLAGYASAAAWAGLWIAGLETARRVGRRRPGDAAL